MNPQATRSEFAQATIDALRDSVLFSTLKPNTLEALASSSVARRYGRGQYVCEQGEAGNSIYLIVSGRIKIVVGAADGEEMLLATLERPATFGEVSLLDGGDRSASAIAMEPSRVASILRPAFLALARDDPSLLERLHTVLGQLVRRLTEQTADLAFLDLHGRVAKLLVQLLERHTDAGRPSFEFDLQMTQSELASTVGGSRQSINQILHQLERTGYLRLDGQHVTIERPDLLRRRAGL